MGYFGYEFVTLSREEVATRRVALDQHARIAQLSQLAVVLLLVCLRFARLLLQRWSRADLEGRPSSPQKKYLSEGQHDGLLSKLDRKYRVFKWRLGNEFFLGYGTWAQWIGGLIWTCWLVFLCFQGTAPDYMHFTKRFGIVAASQLPLHFLLVMKSPYSPIQLLLEMSHESLNTIHQVLGRLIMLLLTAHAACYLNFFIRIGVLAKRIQDRDVIMGLASIVLLSIIGSTAIGFVRRWNYRLFYSIHVIGPMVLLSLLYFHVRHIRVYVLESAAFLVLNLFLRILSSRKTPVEISAVKETNLIRISTSTSTSKYWNPGSHIYLRRSKTPLSYLRSNPFTISGLSTDQDGKLILMARALKRNTQSLARLTKGSGAPVPLTVAIEGPYGESNHFPDLAQFDRILLIAGGVGATFILPVWRHAMQVRSAKSLDYQNIRLHWSVRHLHDAAWAFDAIAASAKDKAPSDDLELYVTKGSVDAAHGGMAMELSDTADAKGLAAQAGKAGFSVNDGRLALRQIVDQVISAEMGRTAVFVCGPPGMGRCVRRHVGRWVMKGKDVFWHAEEFGL